jgi:adhesin transport system outer membrane protein
MRRLRVRGRPGGVETTEGTVAPASPMKSIADIQETRGATRRAPGFATSALAGALTLAVALSGAAAQQRQGGRPAPATPAPATDPAPTPASIGDPVIRSMLDMIQDYELRQRREPLAEFLGRISGVVRDHPQFQAQDQSADAAKGAIDEAWAAYLPTISGNSDGGYRRFGPTFGGTPGYTRNGLGAGVQLRQTVFDFGATSGQVEAARLRLDAAMARREVAESELATRAIAAHVDVMRFRALLALAERNVADRRSIVWLMERREELGGSGSPEVRRGAARLAAARSALLAIENRLRMAEAGYREVYGRHPDTLRLPEDLPPPPPVDAAVASALDRHPSLREARANAGAARLDSDVAVARTLPNVGVEGSLLRRNQIGDGEPATDSSLLLVFRYNIYTGGADTARVNQAAARSRKAELDQRAAGREVERSVRQVSAEVENSGRTIEARIQSVLAGIDALRANREQLEMNRGSFTELLKVQEELFDAGRELIEALFDRSLARYRLAHLTGDLPDLVAGSPTGGREAR